MKGYLLGGGSRLAEAGSALLEFIDDLTGEVPTSFLDPFSGSSEENKTVLHFHTFTHSKKRLTST